jgi:hypothetical protein
MGYGDFNAAFNTQKQLTQEHERFNQASLVKSLLENLYTATGLAIGFNSSKQGCCRCTKISVLAYWVLKQAVF